VPSLRKYLRIRRDNLIDNRLFERSFDYVFCRNVLMYFHEDTRAQVIRRLTSNLKEAGLVFFGHSETGLPVPVELRREAMSAFRRDR
jgi:chemotaxis protein methyltransferase WspC